MLLNTEKSQLFVLTGVFLGFVVSEDGIAVDPAKIAAVYNRPMPKTITKVRSFIYAVNYFRDLIDKFLKKSILLTDLYSGLKNAPVSLSAAA